MKEQPKKTKNSSFTIITSFIALSIIGIALIPLLNIRMYPGRLKPSITISYNMNGANAVIIDNEITTKLEGALSRVEGLSNLKSSTNSGSGRITIEMDKKSDMDAVRFEVSSIIRQIYPSLPEGTSYPLLRINRPDDDDNAETLINFTFNGPGNNCDIGNYAREQIIPVFSDIKGVYSVNIYGAKSKRTDLVYKPDVINNIGLSINEISSQIKEYFNKNSLGSVLDHKVDGSKSYTPVVITGYDRNLFDPSKIIIKHNTRLFHLTDLVDVYTREEDANNFYRINGLNTIIINVSSSSGTNQIVAAKLVKDKAKEIRKLLPDNYSLNVSYDSSITLKNELNKIIMRIISSLVILLLFVLIISRSLRYLVVITISLIVNILTAFIFYWCFGIEINMYSLAGITISLGILIDNTIVMADHLRNGYTIGVFRAILAATFTTMGALVTVLFLDEDLRLKLIDFAWVIIINLTVSLLVSLFLIPALLQKIQLKKKATRRARSRLIRKLKVILLYKKIINFQVRFRWVLILIAIFAFGFPVYMLPSHLKNDDNSYGNEEDKWYYSLYNNTLGSRLYQENIKPVFDVGIGGSLRLFTEKVKHNEISNSNRRTSLTVKCTMNDGGTLNQTNALFKKLENFLAQYDEIDQFETRIYGTSNATLNILFKQNHEYDGFPYKLKSDLESKAIELGSADWQVMGVGRGFDNSLNEGYRNSRIQLYGYNLETLKSYAQKVKGYLLEIQRVDANSIFINGKATTGGNIHRQYYLNLNNDQMERTNINRGAVLNNLRNMSKQQDWLMTIYDNNQPQYVYLCPDNATIPDFWDFKNNSLKISDDRITRLQDLGSFKKEREQDLINKENMEYTMVVEFNFVGSIGQKEYLIGQVEKRIQQDLPVGYRIKLQSYSGGKWWEDKKDTTQVWLLLLIAAIIFFICAIVFESLIQPLIVLLMIPLSFIGVFMTFYWFDLSFDQGGYASLLLLSGLTVNSALYILNALNNTRLRFPNLSPIRAYLKGFNHEITPVILTLLSTMLGLVPFLSGGKKEAFWFSLAAGTIGGLIFSMLIILFILPLFVNGIKKQLAMKVKKLST